MKLRRGMQRRGAGSGTRLRVENLEDRCQPSGLGLSAPILAPLTAPLTTTTTSLLSPTTSLLPTTSSGTSTGSTTGSLLNTAPALTTMLTTLTSAVDQTLTSGVGSTLTVLSQPGLLNTLTSTASALPVTALLVPATTGSGLTSPLVIVSPLGTTLTGLTSDLTSGGLNLNLGASVALGGVLNLSLGTTLGLGSQGLVLNLNLNTPLNTTALLNSLTSLNVTGVINSLLQGTDVTVGVQGQTPVGPVQVGANVSGTPGTDPVSVSVGDVPLLPVPADQLPPVFNLVQTTGRGTGGADGPVAQVFAGGFTPGQTPAGLPGDGLAPVPVEAVVARPALFTPTPAPLATQIVPGPVARGMNGPGAEEKAADPAASGLTLLVAADGRPGAAAPAAADPARGADAAAEAASSAEAASVLADVSPFDLASVEAALARFLDRVGGLSHDLADLAGGAGVYPWVAAAALAAGAFAYRRRKARRGKTGLAAALAQEESTVPWLVDVGGTLPCGPK